MDVQWTDPFLIYPAGTDNKNIIDNATRDFKKAVNERVNVDHNWDTSEGSPQSDHGEHKKITFHEPIVTPTPVADKGFAYTKDVSSKAELHFLDEDGNESQLTSGGQIATFPAGTKMWFYQNTAPVGWTIDSGVEDCCIAVKGGSEQWNVSGGTEAGAWEYAGHVHSSETLGVSGSVDNGGGYDQEEKATFGYIQITKALSGFHTTTDDPITITASISGNSGTSTTSDNRPSAAVGIIATKD